MPPARFEPVIPASDRPQTVALDSSATWTGNQGIQVPYFIWKESFVISNRFSAVSEDVRLSGVVKHNN